MILTVFRSRLNAETTAAYKMMAKRMSALAKAVPGYVSHKSFIAEDGERVTIIEFESEAALQHWRVDPDHREAKKMGVQTFFSEYRMQICAVNRDKHWKAAAASAFAIPAVKLR